MSDFKENERVVMISRNHRWTQNNYDNADIHKQYIIREVDDRDSTLKLTPVNSQTGYDWGSQADFVKLEDFKHDHGVFNEGQRVMLKSRNGYYTESNMDSFSILDNFTVVQVDKSDSTIEVHHDSSEEDRHYWASGEDFFIVSQPVVAEVVSPIDNLKSMKAAPIQEPVSPKITIYDTGHHNKQLIVEGMLSNSMITRIIEIVQG